MAAVGADVAAVVLTAVAVVKWTPGSPEVLLLANQTPAANLSYWVVANLESFAPNHWW